MPKQKSASMPRKNDSCKKITDLISNDLADRLRSTVKREFERHLKICPDCVSFLNTHKKTVSLTGSLSVGELRSKFGQWARLLAAKSASNHRVIFLFGDPRDGMTEAPAMLI